jgi:hypothetical protein
MELPPIAELIASVAPFDGNEPDGTEFDDSASDDSESVLDEMNAKYRSIFIEKLRQLLDERRMSLVDDVVIIDWLMANHIKDQYIFYTISQGKLIFEDEFSEERFWWVATVAAMIEQSGPPGGAEVEFPLCVATVADDHELDFSKPVPIENTAIEFRNILRDAINIIRETASEPPESTPRDIRDAFKMRDVYESATRGELTAALAEALESSQEFGGGYTGSATNLAHCSRLRLLATSTFNGISPADVERATADGRLTAGNAAAIAAKQLRNYTRWEFACSKEAGQWRTIMAESTREWEKNNTQPRIVLPVIII